MAVILSADIIKDIAEDLEMGMKCWYHIPTGEVLSAPDSLRHDYIDDEIWADTFKDIDEKIEECIAFEGLATHEEFSIMESFAENQVSDPEVRSRLAYALSQRKPFMHFKSAIHYDSDYLDAWYAYKLQCYIDHVRQQLDYYNSEEDEE